MEEMATETMLLVDEMQTVTDAPLTLVSVCTTSIQVSGIGLTDAIAAVGRVEGHTMENGGPERDLSVEALDGEAIDGNSAAGCAARAATAMDKTTMGETTVMTFVEANRCVRRVKVDDEGNIIKEQPYGIIDEQAARERRLDATVQLHEARPSEDLLMHVYAGVNGEFDEARSRYRHLGCCALPWEPEPCGYGQCHGCLCKGVTEGEDARAHLHGSLERFFRQALADAKLLPDMIVHMAREHLGVHIAKVSDLDEELRSSAEARLRELKRRVTRTAKYEHWAR